MNADENDRSGPLVALETQLAPLLGSGALLHARAERLTYQSDGLKNYHVVPGLVVLPRTGEEVSAAVRACAAFGVPFVARGSGTGLSGGALPLAHGALIVTAKMRSIAEVDEENERAIVEPGVANLAISDATASAG